MIEFRLVVPDGFETQVDVTWVDEHLPTPDLTTKDPVVDVVLTLELVQMLVSLSGLLYVFATRGLEVA
jgi:hypothetical protein